MPDPHTWEDDALQVALMATLPTCHSGKPPFAAVTRSQAMLSAQRVIAHHPDFVVGPALNQAALAMWECCEGDPGSAVARMHWHISGYRPQA